MISADGSGKISLQSSESEVSDNSSNEAKSSGGNLTGLQKITEGPVYFNGLGYGHGVGMPQDSAIEMAKQGFDYEEILEYYYTDIEISEYE